MDRGRVATATHGEEKQQRDQAKLAKAYEKALETFWASPVGQARKAFEAGDHVFQYSIDVLNQQAIILAMIGSTTSRRQQDPSAVLNAVCREGWELVNGDFVFLQQGQQSRDKFMSSGQNVAIKGAVVGYYLFRRSEANRKSDTEEELKQRIRAEVYGE